MIQTELKKAMTASISDVLETMFFMVMECQEPEAGQELTIFKKEKLHGCHLEFTGPLSGGFLLVAPEELLMEMAVDFMGESRDNIRFNHMEGTLKESLNMIAGNTFSHYDNTLEIKIGLPEMISLDRLKGVVDSREADTLLIKVITEKSEILLTLNARE